MKTIVFAPDTSNLSETSRMIEIAKACRSLFHVLFMSYGGPFEQLICEEQFCMREMSPRLTDEKIEHIFKVGRGEKLEYFFSEDELHEQVRNELAFFDDIQPDALVTGYCKSVPVSTRVAGVPLIWIIQSTWIPSYYEAGLGTWPDMFDIPLFRWIPDHLLNRMSQKLLVSLPNFLLPPVNNVARQYGVKTFKNTEFWEGDYTLLAEPPEFSGLTNVPPRYRYIGPLITRLNADIPSAVQHISRDRPIVYFAMGSSGNPEIIARIIEGFRGKPYQVIAPVKSHLEKMHVNVPPNVIVTGWLPAHKVNPMADISVIHGGIGTVMTACLSGTPVVGIGMQPEQEANIECLVRKGFAIRIRKKRANAQAVLDAIDQLMYDKEAHRKAQAFQKIMEQWDGPTNAARFFVETFGSSTVEPLEQSVNGEFEHGTPAFDNSVVL